MIKDLHSKNTSLKEHRGKNPDLNRTISRMLREASKDLLQPRDEAIASLLAKAMVKKTV